MVVDRDPIFRLLVVALLDGSHRTVDAVDPYEAAYLCRNYAPELLVARPGMALQLPRLLVAAAVGPLEDQPPALIVVTGDDPISLRYAGVATAVQRSRFVEDLPDALAWALEAREGRGGATFQT